MIMLAEDQLARFICLCSFC